MPQNRGLPRRIRELNRRRSRPPLNPNRPIRRAMKKKLTILGIQVSKKFTAKLIGVAGAWGTAKAGLPADLTHDLLWAIAGIVSFYIFGQSIVDAAERKAPPPPPQPAPGDDTAADIPRAIPVPPRQH